MSTERYISSDIYSYTLFANIDKRDGNIEGHMMFLSAKQLEAIEQIVLSEKIQVKENPLYKVEDE